MVEKYQAINLHKKDLKTINKILKTLTKNPQVIMISNTKKQLSIYDSWHTSNTFYVENKPILAYIGIADDFNCLRIK